MQRGRVSQVLERMAEQQGERPLIVSDERVISYNEFFQSVKQLARSLLSVGIQKGDHVGIWLSNRVEFILVEMAADLMGAVGVPISTRYKSDELAYILRHANIRIVFMMDTLVNIDFFKVLEAVIPNARSMVREDLPPKGLPVLKHVVCVRTTDKALPGLASGFDEFLSKGGEDKWKRALADVQRTVAPDELSYIQYTSGSTGFPKGVMYSHEQVLTSVMVQGERFEMTPDDRMLLVAPFYHGLGHMAGPPLGIAFGTSMVALETFDPGKALQYIEKYRCTILSAVPTMFQMMLEHPDFPKTDVSSLRSGLISAAPSPRGLKTKIMEEFMISLLAGYGATETGGGCTQCKLNDPTEIVEETIGFPLRTYEVKIIDPSTGRELPPGVPGELCARGPCIMLGYYGEEEKSSEVVDENGWFHSGDLATSDENGYMRIVGRIKELIITGGNNVYPAEVEALLERHPAVKGAQVIGVPDKLKGEVVMAYIVPKAGTKCTQEEIQAFCKERTSNYKVPQYVRFVEGFPISAAGKVSKEELKKRATEELNQ